LLAVNAAITEPKQELAVSISLKIKENVITVVPLVFTPEGKTDVPTV
jgi:hypothetical protein